MDNFNENDDMLDDVLDNLDIDVEKAEDTSSKIDEELGKDTSLDTASAKEPHKIFYGLSKEDRELAVKLQVVPRAYANATFDVDKIKENIIRSMSYSQSSHLPTKKIYKFNEYIDTCYGILSSIRMRQLPTRSYIIGAPNSFGKASFVTESLITLLKQGFRVVPYISLVELAQVKKDYESSFLESTFDEKTRFLIKNDDGVFERVKTQDGHYKIGSEYVKKAKSIEHQYSYYDYMNADCLFVKLSSQTSKEVESYILYQLLSIRADKGLPTIVTVPFSLDIYKKDIELREYVWDEILTKTERENCYDRLYHVSCYSRPNLGGLSSKNEVIDNTTGIVEG